MVMVCILLENYSVERESTRKEEGTGHRHTVARFSFLGLGRKAGRLGSSFSPSRSLEFCFRLSFPPFPCIFLVPHDVNTGPFHVHQTH